MAITKKALSSKRAVLVGFQCHVGSQVFDSDTFIRSARIMVEYLDSVRKETGFEAKQLSLGGGYGVRYTEEDPELDLEQNILQVGKEVRSLCEKYNFPQPKILLEPGRSIVADAGLTLYSVGTVKRIPGYKNYVSVNGGMTDNPRFALYGAVHTPVLPEKMDEERDMVCSVVGACCESGDIICEGARLPSSVKRDDLLAVLTTGAYNYSMASNYNRIPRPPVVMLSEGRDYLAVRRETPEDVAGLDV
jgi:diaminopimelate decarboxylase